MNQTFQNPLNESSVFLALSRAVEQGRGPVQILEITASQDAHLISELGRERKKKKLVITYDEARARRLCEDLSCFLDRVYYYPAKDLLFFSADIRSRQISGERIQV